jgi:hypothetical protein
MSFTPDFMDEDARWWKASAAIHERIFALVDRIDSDQSDRASQLGEYQRLYEDRGKALGGTSGKRVTYNLIRSCIDTASAKIAKNRPRPLFLTSGAKYELQTRAKKLTKFIDGIYAEMKVYDEGQLVFRDACTLDGGALKVFVEDDKIRCERAHVSELRVDRIDGRYGKPRQMHQVRHMHREVLAERFPQHKFEILAAAPASLTKGGMDTAIAPSMVEVVESWHLPSGKKAKDGRHTLCIETATLVDEGYDKSYFPFVFFWWNLPMTGFWSPGLAEELKGIQHETNRLLDDISIAQKLMGRPFWAVERSADVQKSHITNEIGSILEYSGPQPPTPGISQAMAPEVYQHLERLYTQKPSGLDSGKALREFQDIESERFVLVGQRYESFFMDVCRRVIDLARDLYADGVNYEVKSRAGRFLESISWEDVDLEDDQYELQVFPVSILPTTPAGRYEMVVDLSSNGLVTPEQAKRLLDFPDIEDEMSLDLASQDCLRMILDRMIEGGPYRPPEPFFNLELAKKLGVLTYLRGITQNATEDDLDKIRNWLSDVETLVTMSAAGGPQEMQGMAAAAGAAAPQPGAPPMMGPDGQIAQFGAPPLPPSGLQGIDPMLMAPQAVA